MSQVESRAELMTAMETLMYGNHTRLGEASPVQTLSELPARLIGNFLREDLDHYLYWKISVYR
jgi:hypothetical protein